MSLDAYLKAKKIGLKDDTYKAKNGEKPGIVTLMSIEEHINSLNKVSLGLKEIDIDQIVGTVNNDRANAFSCTFLPVLDQNTEFAMKWSDLYDSAIEIGISNPIDVYEYMNKFYVIEGNKRVSIMKYLGAASMECNVIRVLPRPSDTPEYRIYQSFLTFYSDTGYYGINFTKEDSYIKLYGYFNYEPGKEWSEEDLNTLRIMYRHFTEEYSRQVKEKLSITKSDAFLIFLDIYGIEYAREMIFSDISSDIRNIKDEFFTKSQDCSVVLLMKPDYKPYGFLSSVLWPGSNNLKASFIYSGSPNALGWTYCHEKGRQYIEEVFEGRVETSFYPNVLPDKAEDLMKTLVQDNADVIFTDSPVFLNAAVKTALRYPNVRILNCSLLATYHKIRAYYLRTYEATFVLGAIAGSVCKGNKIGYIADYPIWGTPANINAFALGAQMTNANAKILLRWGTNHSGLDAMELLNNGAEIVAMRNIAIEDASIAPFGISMKTDSGLSPIATSQYNWGNLYEALIDSIFDGTWKAEENENRHEAINYWWGFSSGALDVRVECEFNPSLSRLMNLLKFEISSGNFVPFADEIYSNTGEKKCSFGSGLTPGQIIAMNYLVKNVEGHIPSISELGSWISPLVELQGISDISAPDPESFLWSSSRKEGRR